jgi:hypothetical protein
MNNNKHRKQKSEEHDDNKNHKTRNIFKKIEKISRKKWIIAWMFFLNWLLEPMVLKLLVKGSIINKVPILWHRVYKISRITHRDRVVWTMEEQR